MWYTAFLGRVEAGHQLLVTWENGKGVVWRQISQCIVGHVRSLIFFFILALNAQSKLMPIRIWLSTGFYIFQMFQSETNPFKKNRNAPAHVCMCDFSLWLLAPQTNIWGRAGNSLLPLLMDFKKIVLILTEWGLNLLRAAKPQSKYIL